MSQEVTGVEAWIEHADWVRGLARALVRDEHEAEDLAQEAWLATLEGGPSRPPASKAWFAGVLRNLARARLRGSKRREAREQDAARRELTAPDDSPLERLEIHERLVAAVRGLDEPCRSAILLRYFDGLTPGEIAERTRAPLRTVHTRLQRGLERLRERLDRDHDGDRGAWLAALAPLLPRLDAPVIGALLVKLKVGWIAAGVLLLLAAGVLGIALLSRPDPTASVSAAAGKESVEASEIVEVAQESERTARPSPPATLADAPVQSPKRIHGIVLGIDDQPIEGVRVGFVPKSKLPALETLEAISDERGEFAMVDPQIPGALRSLSEGFATVLEPRVGEYEVEPIYALVVASSAPLAGVVVDNAGVPLAEAHVSIVLPRDLRTRLQHVLDRSATSPWEVVSDAAGQFRMPNAPLMPRALLTTSHAGCDPIARQLLPDDGRESLRIELSCSASHPDRLDGTVVFPAGLRCLTPTYASAAAPTGATSAAASRCIASIAPAGKNCA
ncbi:MAG TPA: sigma-70 family RNA polymerase sigma factor [Planctomycetota bacterium]|nr:sigma-70 family RNA polymerase sigma factor [Planctomycetota bacterium]